MNNGTEIALGKGAAEDADAAAAVLARVSVGLCLCRRRRYYHRCCSQVAGGWLPRTALNRLIEWQNEEKF